MYMYMCIYVYRVYRVYISTSRCSYRKNLLLVMKLASELTQSVDRGPKLAINPEP